MDRKRADSRAPLTVAAAGDIHCRASHRAEIVESFAGLDRRADLVLLAGDLTSVGEPSEAAILAEACEPLGAPVLAVLGNHDWHHNRAEELIGILSEGGVRVLDRDHAVVEVAGLDVGVVGTKGFVGGFRGSHLPDFGEPALRMIYAETTTEVKAIARGLQAVSICDVRIVLLHYSPTESTLRGEPEGIWAFLGTDRMAGPIREHEPDLVLHGHAHYGAPQASIAAVPVYNVSVPAMERDFWFLELTPDRQPKLGVH